MWSGAATRFRRSRSGWRRWRPGIDAERAGLINERRNNTGEDALTAIPKALQEHINTAYPAHVCLIGTVLPNGYAQVTPRGSTMVYDDEHFALWERGKGSTNASLADGTKVTVYFRKPPLRESGLLPRGGIARFYGTAKLYKSGPVYEEIWKRLIEPEKKSDPDKKGFGVLIKVERAEDLGGAPLAI
jgi:hypothetical protein